MLVFPTNTQSRNSIQRMPGPMLQSTCHSKLACIPRERSYGGICIVRLHTVCISYPGACPGERTAVVAMAVGNSLATTLLSSREALAAVGQIESNAPLPRNCKKSWATGRIENGVVGTN
jgi:hypothetical protein